MHHATNAYIGHIFHPCGQITSVRLDPCISQMWSSTKTIYLAQWFIATAELPVAHVQTHVAAEFFSSFYGSFGARVFNAGMFLFVGRIELDLGGSLKRGVDIVDQQARDVDRQVQIAIHVATGLVL